MIEDHDARLDLTIAAPEGVVYRPDHLPVRASFVNQSSEPLRLLDVFEPLPVFFEVDMEAEDGRWVEEVGMGKADIPESHRTYVELDPGQAFELLVRLEEAVLPGEVVPGRYTTGLVYHNQYGEDCFRGVVESNRITIEVRA